MDRPIKQTYAPVKRLMAFAGAMFFVVLIICGVIVYRNGQHDLVHLLKGSLILGLALAFMLSLVVFVVSGQGAKWFVTDTGLKRVTLFGDKTTIAWDQVYHMAVKNNSLFIHWRELPPPGVQVSREELERRAILYPDRADADELIALWQKKTSRESQAEGHAHFRSVTAKDSSQTRHLTTVLIAIGGVFIAWATLNIFRQYPSTSWPSVAGKIISQQYHLLPYDAKHHHQDAQLDLSYEYKTDGQIYHATRYSLWHPIYQDDDDAVRDFMDAHSNGAPVAVYFDPKNPAQGVLLTGPDWRGNSAFAVLGSFLAFIGFLIRIINQQSGRGRKA